MNGNKQDRAGKLPFTAPKLEVYGRARDITRALGNTGNTDGPSGGPGANKTRI